MLLSRQIKLLAAFDHRHIFLDPDPDPQRSFVERERLFKLPRSSWEDYNVELISEGGGVYSRQSKEIPLSPQVRRWLGVRQSSLDVAGLIRLLLAAEADLFWNGGIGTYVRASFESDEEAGDRANDAVRIDATQLRVRVIGEGGNLGLTQQARIEYAQLGGCINTDAVDNSAGVDSSDHEVNLKIMLQVLRQQGELADLKEGYRLLDEMEETVCADVLDNNYGQTLALSLDTLRCEADVEPFLDLMDRLGRAGMLDRRDEFLPARKVVATRQPNRLLRPELSVLLAYSKMFFYRALLESDLPASAAAAHLLHDYFPEQMNERYGAYLQQHPLAKEITATMITNRIVDLAGSTFWLTLSRQTGSEPAEVARAYLVFDKLLNGPALRRAVFALDNCMPSQRQYQLLLKLEGLLGAFCRFALDQRMALPEEPAELADYAEQLERYAQLIPDVLSKKQRQDCRKFAEQLQAEGLDEELARRFAMLDHLNGFLPLAGLVRGTEYGLDQMLRLDRFVADTLQTAQLLACLESVPVRDSWDRRARESLIGSSRKVLLRLIQAVAAENLQTPEQYFRGRRQGFRAFADLRDRLLSEPPANFHPYTVILAALEALLQER
jgi:glutamate dehydrogenase